MSDRRKRPRIWITDDSPTEALITERALGADYEFEKFADGSVVVERLASSPTRPDVLLLDWVMPGMTGDEVCRYLRSNPATHELPIIMVTASRVETNDVVTGLRAGADDYVARPFAPEELRARVEAVLRASKLREAATRERARLDTVNQLGRALLAAGSNIDGILDQLASTLTVSMCDGCSIQLLPGASPAAQVQRHRGEPTGAALAAISSLADPTVKEFDSADDARTQLPPAYHAYIDRFGLSGLAILPFPTVDPIQGIVTVTRDDAHGGFDGDDIATIETCIEYAALAVRTALRFDAERASRDQLHAVLEHLAIGIVATDAAGAVNLVNSTATSLVPGAAAAKDLVELAGLVTWTEPDGAPVSADAWLERHAQFSNHASRSELIMIRPGGARSTVLLSTVPLHDARGTLVGSVTAIEDVSADRAIEAERHAIGHYQQQMLGIVGHDLRNPLSALSTGISLIEALGEPVPKIGPVAKRLSSSVVRMTRIVEQLLDVTRLRFGEGLPMSPHEVTLIPIVRGAIEELGMAYRDTSFELVATTDVTGFWDPDRLSQMLSNLMSNAAQYGRAGTPVVITLAQVGDSAQIAVSNTNRDKPIPRELIDVLFDPYKRGRDEKRHTGLGLGLYIVHEIVKAHHGAIEVESTEQMTTFRVTVPLHRA